MCIRDRGTINIKSGMASNLMGLLSPLKTGAGERPSTSYMSRVREEMLESGLHTTGKNQLESLLKPVTISKPPSPAKPNLLHSAPSNPGYNGRSPFQFAPKDSPNVHRSDRFDDSSEYLPQRFQTPRQTLSPFRTQNVAEVPPRPKIYSKLGVSEERPSLERRPSRPSGHSKVEVANVDSFCFDPRASPPPKAPKLSVQRVMEFCIAPKQQEESRSVSMVKEGDSVISAIHNASFKDMPAIVNDKREAFQRLENKASFATMGMSLSSIERENLSSHLLSERVDQSDRRLGPTVSVYASPLSEQEEVDDSVNVPSPVKSDQSEIARQSEGVSAQKVRALPLRHLLEMIPRPEPTADERRRSSFYVPSSDSMIKRPVDRPSRGGSITLSPNDKTSARTAEFPREPPKESNRETFVDTGRRKSREDYDYLREQPMNGIQQMGLFLYQTMPEYQKVTAKGSGTQPKEVYVRLDTSATKKRKTPQKEKEMPPANNVSSQKIMQYQQVIREAGKSDFIRKVKQTRASRNTASKEKTPNRKVSLSPTTRRDSVQQKHGASPPLFNFYEQQASTATKNPIRATSKSPSQSSAKRPSIPNQAEFFDFDELEAFLNNYNGLLLEHMKNI
eukprot:TRINITY_DN7642_c0_g3_i4.p1 TRINITY_DN7642_c0_g3~~TRINITY_DN7642_c0_g3_i4.p1  ORF type:complete len:619 (-),score=101.18 TRINITY_DN7642_c0_g3_i4:863-2719(-)